MSERDQFFMARALRLARKGLYSTHPNPRVGCVIVRDGEIVGEGWHARAGEPHAEVHALRQAGDKARGATAYVTLEPCSHHGRTPPCADALVAAGVSRVVAAMQDPNPQVAGSGLLRLAQAGIEVASGVLESEARALNAGFIKRMESGLPFVRVKSAMSLDGRTAMASGESQWITGPAARAEVQRLRAQSSVVLSGADTVLADEHQKEKASRVCVYPSYYFSEDWTDKVKAAVDAGTDVDTIKDTCGIKAERIPYCIWDEESLKMTRPPKSTMSKRPEHIKGNSAKNTARFLTSAQFAAFGDWLDQRPDKSTLIGRVRTGENGGDGGDVVV